jgi:hypothetical protein
LHLHDIEWDDLKCAMNTLPIECRNDEKKIDDYRSKLLLLEIYDRMQEAITTGRPYQTILSPPPTDPRCCHPPREGGRW